MTTITREQFIAATGEEPMEDDLDRCNCVKAGQAGHYSCGWNHKHNLPVFMVGPELAELTKQLEGEVK